MVTFDELYNENRLPLRYYIMKRTFDPQLWDDVEQETWIKISKKWEQYDGSRAFLPWAKGSFDNALTKVLAFKERHKRDVEYEKERQELALAAKETESVIPACLKSDHRLVTLYKKHYIGEETLKEIACREGWNGNKVNYLHYKLKKALKENNDIT